MPDLEIKPGVYYGQALEDLKDRTARAAFGMTISDAHERKMCIMCKKKPDLSKPVNAQEYKQSALCDSCFDEITKVGEDSD